LDSKPFGSIKVIAHAHPGHYFHNGGSGEIRPKVEDNLVFFKTVHKRKKCETVFFKTPFKKRKMRISLVQD
jgi:hypothetical protein